MSKEAEGMEGGRHSRTALGTAFMRAHHYAHDQPKLFADPYAHLMLSASDRESVELRFLEGLQRLDPARAASCPDRQTALALAMRVWLSPAHILARARYTEDKLSEAVQQGLRHYVIIGAGLDTFAWRHLELQERLHVVELDHPATQAFKQQRLAQVGLKPPPNLRFVPVDLERESLATVLARLAFKAGVPVFFSWLGVTSYLSHTAIQHTWQAISQGAPTGSQLVFDYLDADAFTADKSSARVRQMLESVRDVGEPMRAGLDPSTLDNALSASGLRLIEDLGPDEVQQRYFEGRTDGFRAGDHSHLVWARVE